MRLAVVVLVACTPYAPDLPAEPFFCGSGAKACPDGYTCVGAGSDAVCAHRAGSGSGSGSGSCPVATQGVLASWTFDGQASGPRRPSRRASAAPGISAGAIARAAVLVAVAGSNSIDASNWATTAHLDATRYYTLTITPPDGRLLDLTAMAVDAAAATVWARPAPRC